MGSQFDLSVPSLFNFHSHVVLITGGATGLGEMAAQGFIQNGARVIIASRKEDILKRTTDRLNLLGPGKCEYIVADLKDKAGCEKLVNEVKHRTNRLTVLVNNSGITYGGPYKDFPESGWDKVMAVNVKSIFYITVGLQSLLQNGASAGVPGRVINVASVAGVSANYVLLGPEGGRSENGPLSYGPSKAACVHLTKILASKLAPLNIVVNCICPGLFPSRITNYSIEKFGDIFLRRQPTGRIGRPGDFAGVVLFLSSLASAHMTGNVLVLDGGSTISGWEGRTQPSKI